MTLRGICAIATDKHHVEIRIGSKSLTLRAEQALHLRQEIDDAIAHVNRLRMGPLELDDDGGDFGVMEAERGVDERNAQ